jgi:2-iminobutanoate/2-iminopropanoate deaminase
LISIGTGAIREGSDVEKTKLEPSEDAPLVSEYLRLRAEGVGRGALIPRLKITSIPRPSSLPDERRYRIRGRRGCASNCHISREGFMKLSRLIATTAVQGQQSGASASNPLLGGDVMAAARMKSLDSIMVRAIRVTSTCALVMAASGFPGVAVAHGGDATLIHACINEYSGTVRLVSPDDSCRGPEFAVDWRTAAGSAPIGAKQVIATPNAPPAIGPYSQAIKISAGATMYVAGQLPLDPVTSVIVPGDITVQTQRVMDNLIAVLTAGGMTIDDVMMAHVYLKDLNDFAAFNAAYAAYFGSAPPARATVQVARIPRDALIEIALIAAK